jgi:hypothetical protein
MRATTDITIGIDTAAVGFGPPFDLTVTMMVVVAIAVCEEEPVREAVWVFKDDTVGVSDEVEVTRVALVLVVLPVVVRTVEVLEALRQRGSAVQIHSVKT